MVRVEHHKKRKNNSERLQALNLSSRSNDTFLRAISQQRGELALWGTDDKFCFRHSEFGVVEKQPR